MKKLFDNESGSVPVPKAESKPDEAFTSEAANFTTIVPENTFTCLPTLVNTKNAAPGKLLSAAFCFYSVKFS